MSPPSSQPPPVGKALRVVTSLLPYVRPYRRQLLVAVLMTMAFILVGIARPWPIKVVIDQVILGLPWSALPESLAGRDGAPTLLLLCCAAVIGLAVAGSALLYAKTILLASIGQRVVARLREALHDHLLAQSLDWRNSQRSGDLLVRLSGDTVMMRQLLVEGIFALFEEILLVIGVLAVVAWLDLQIAVVAALVVPLVAALMVYFGKKLRTASRRQRQKEGQIGAAITESLSAVALIQAYALEQEAARRFAKRNRKSLKAGLKAARFEGQMTGWTEVSLALGVGATLLIGGNRVLAGQLTAGELLVLLSYVRALYRPLRKVVTKSSRLFKSVACGERVLEILTADSQLPQPSRPIKPEALAGHLVFDRVSFAYSPDRPVLRDVRFEVRPGETIALLGSNGCGKSTIASLVPRLRDPDRGAVRVDGHDVRELDVRTLRDSVAIVLQDTLLFDGTLRDNIRLGCPDASAEQVEQAARLSGAAAFASSLPDGLDTEVGERGVALSGGERQRIALARAIVRDASIVVLDEPTTALDAESEERFTRDLLERLRGRTVILMTHNRRLLAGVDRVLTLKEGVILEQARSSVVRDASVDLDAGAR